MTKLIEPTEYYKYRGLEDLPGEIWKDALGWEGFYQVSNMGRIKSLSRVKESAVVRWEDEMIISQGLTTKGYCIVSFCKDGKHNTRLVQRLVGIHFIPNPENKRTINHKKGIKTDNRATELEWSTMLENNQHAIDTGLRVSAKGSRCRHTKLTELQVVEIRELLKTSMSQSEIAEIFNVSRRTIGNIGSGKNWKWV